MKKIRLSIVEDQELFIDLLKISFKDIEEIEVVQQALHGCDLLEQLQYVQPDIILLDLEMPVLNGYKTLLILNEFHPEIKVVILTQHDSMQLAYQLIGQGAHAYLDKNTQTDKLIEILNVVFQKGDYMSEDQARYMMRMNKVKNAEPTIKPNMDPEKEQKVIEGIMAEMTGVEIGEKACMSLASVKKYKSSIFEKYDVKGAGGLMQKLSKNNRGEWH